MKIRFVASDAMTDHQKESIKKLRGIVYPPEVLATLPWRHYTWSSMQWSVLLWDEDELTAKASLLVREVFHNDIPKRIGGIGGVMTNPSKQGQGLASQAMREAAKRFEEDLHVDYALLFCRDHLIPFYSRLGWKSFEGQIFVEQPQGKIEFSANDAMVLDVKEAAPLNGTLDLNGLPW